MFAIHTNPLCPGSTRPREQRSERCIRRFAPAGTNPLSPQLQTSLTWSLDARRKVALLSDVFYATCAISNEDSNACASSGLAPHLLSHSKRLIAGPKESNRFLSRDIFVLFPDIRCQVQQRSLVKMAFPAPLMEGPLAAKAVFSPYPPRDRRAPSSPAHVLAGSDRRLRYTR